jgi:hypothetical protein
MALTVILPRVMGMVHAVHYSFVRGGLIAGFSAAANAPGKA